MQRENHAKRKAGIHDKRERRVAQTQDEGCNCNQYSQCLQCRNRERRAAFKENRIPAYVLGTMAPAALNQQAVRATAGG